MTVVSTGIGYLDAWIDWNGDGDLLDAGEKIIDTFPVQTGTFVFNIATPATAVAGFQLARVRLSATGGLLPNGTAVGGEVEIL